MSSPSQLSAGSPPMEDRPSPASSPTEFLPLLPMKSPVAVFKGLCALARSNPPLCAARVRGIEADKGAYMHFASQVSEEALLHIAGIANEHDDPSLACHYFHKATQVDAGRFKVRSMLRLALLQTRLTNFAQAQAIFWAISPDQIPPSYHAQVQLAYAKLSLALHPTVNPLPYLIATIENPSDKPKDLAAKQEARCLAAKCLVKSGNLCDAQPYIEQFITHAATFCEDCLLMHYYALHYVQNSSDLKAVEDHATSIVSQGDSPYFVEALFSRFRSYMKRGLIREAQADLIALQSRGDLAERLAPDQLTRYHFYAIALDYHAANYEALLPKAQNLLLIDLSNFMPLRANLLAILGIAQNALGMAAQALETLRSIAIDTMPVVLDPSIQVHQAAQNALQIAEQRVRIDALKEEISELDQADPARVDLEFNLALLQRTLNMEAEALESLSSAFFTASQSGQIDHFVEKMKAHKLYSQLILTLNHKDHTRFCEGNVELIKAIEVGVLETILSDEESSYEELKLLRDIRFSKANERALPAKIYYELGVQEGFIKRKRQYFTLAASPIYREFLSESERAVADANKP